MMPRVNLSNSSAFIRLSSCDTLSRLSRSSAASCVIFILTVFAPVGRLHLSSKNLTICCRSPSALCLLCGSGKDVEEIESHDDKVVGEFKYVVLAYRHEVTRRVCHKRACVALCESEKMLQLQCVGRSEAFLHRVGTVVGVGYDIHFAVDKEHELVAHVVLLPYDLAFGKLLKMKFRLAYHLCQFVLAHALKERYLQ